VASSAPIGSGALSQVKTHMMQASGIVREYVYKSLDVVHSGAASVIKYAYIDRRRHHSDHSQICRPSRLINHMQCLPKAKPRSSCNEAAVNAPGANRLTTMSRRAYFIPVLLTSPAKHEIHRHMLLLEEMNEQMSD